MAAFCSETGAQFAYLGSYIQEVLPGFVALLSGK